MPRGTKLNNEEIHKIDAFRNCGLGIRDIGRRINRSDAVIRNYFKKAKNYGIKKPTKGNQKISKRSIGQIKEEATKNKLSASHIVSKLNLTVTTRRVQQILHSCEHIVYRKSIKSPNLKKGHKEARLQFAKTVMHWNTEWKNIIFSDEKKFNLDGPDGLSYYWHDLKKSTSPRMSRNFGGGSIMFWGAFSYSEKLPLVTVPCKMNAEGYTDVLEEVLIPYLEKNNNVTFTFQQDNAPVHSAKFTKQWLHSKNVCQLQWPSLSPDLNPMENLWGILARKIYGNCRQFQTVNDLKSEILKCWAEIDETIVKSLINSMPNRIFEVIRCNGAKTNY